jgi:arylsulfate sulfotransferase
MKNAKLTLFAGFLFCFVSRFSEAASVMITGQTPGATPFISNIQLSASPASSIKNIKFTITPKPGSVTRPISATYTSDYLKKRGFYNSQTGAILLPVFGLYDGYTNTVTLNYTFTDDSAAEDETMVATDPFADPCGFNTPTVVQARTNSTSLSYDFIFIRTICSSFSPTIIDTDGAIRWVGTAGFANFSALLYQNSIFIAHDTTLYRMEFDGAVTPLKDYASEGVVDFHHNIDPGKRGILAEVDTTTQVESVNLELDSSGNILKRWDLATIISAAMTAGGDDPTNFVTDPPGDWFHNNATTYKRSDDSLLVSSRENFVIALDHGSGAIKWILGDKTKQWFQFPSLQPFALSLDGNSLPPIGQHALSISKDDNLLLFDNGQPSAHHVPAGDSRSYSAARKYQINTQTKLATELWNFANGETRHSPFCSSIYEDAPLNYLVDYAILDNITQGVFIPEILGLDSAENVIFDYRYTTTNCNTAYNSFPIHLENIVFNVVLPPRVDFNADTFNDLLLFNDTNHATAMWHLKNNLFQGSRFGPTLPPGWTIVGAADVNLDGEPDYILFEASTRRTAVWFLDDNVRISSAYGPALPVGWAPFGVADFNNDRWPDLVLFNPSTRQTAVWYLHETVFAGSVNGPVLPSGWTLNDIVDLNGDNKADYLLVNSTTNRTAVWYLNGVAFTSSVFGPTLPAGWSLQGAADFNGDAKPDYLLYRSSTRSTAFWYLDGVNFISSAFGPAISAGYSPAFP